MMAKRVLVPNPWVIVALVVVVFVYVHVRARIEYAGIEIGMTGDEVQGRLGAPRRTAPDLMFCTPSIPWSGECPPASSGLTFLYYKYGIDRWIVVGLDAEARVRFKTLGDT